MSKYVRHRYSGKTLRITHEDDLWIVLRPIPDDHGPDIRVSVAHFASKWERVSGVDVSGRIETEPAIAGGWPLPGVPKPEPRKRGRPKGSKNKPKAAV